jgi:hypothetical protein
MAKATSASPAHAASRDARARLDRAVAALRLVPIRFDRAPVADALRRAMTAIFVAIDTDVDAIAHDEAVEESARSIAAAIALLSPIALKNDLGGALRSVLVELEEARVSMSGAADALASLRLTRRRVTRGGRDSNAPQTFAPLRASVGVPRVHAFARARLIEQLGVDPVVPIAERRRKKRGVPMPAEALRALADAAKRGEGAAAMLGPEPTPPAATPPAVEAREHEEVRRIAEDCLSDLGSLGLLRAPGPTEKWTDAGPFEQRLLDLLDAFASLGADVMPLLPLHVAESPAPDPARAFAATFVLGCFAGVDAASAAVDLLVRVAPEALAGARDGIALASSADVDAAIVERLTSALPDDARARLIEALLARHATFPIDALGDVLGADASLRPLLARAVDAAAMPAADAIALLEDLRDLEHEPAAAFADDTFFAATEALLRRGHARSRERLRRAVEAEGARADRAAALLCLCGGADDVTRLVRRFTEAPSPRLARALGRFGHVDALPSLLAALSQSTTKQADSDDASERVDVSGDAADALARITGAPLFEIVEVPWGEGAPPPIEGEAPRPTRKVRVPSRDPAAWSAWLARDARSLDRKLRHRHGQALHPRQLVDELLAEETSAIDRREAARELAFAGVTPRLHRVDDWVARQRASLAALREELERLRVSAGRWGRANEG